MSATMNAYNKLPESGNLREYIGSLNVEVAVRVVRALISERLALDTLTHGDLNHMFDGILLAHSKGRRTGDIQDRVREIVREVTMDMPVNAACDLTDLLPDDLVDNTEASQSLYRLLSKSLNFCISRPNRTAGAKRRLVVRRVHNASKGFRTDGPATRYIPKHRRSERQAG